MTVPNTYSETPGHDPVWIESMGDARGRDGLEVLNTLKVTDEADSVSFTVLSEVVGTWAPTARTEIAVRVSDSDAQKVIDRLAAILAKRNG